MTELFKSWVHLAEENRVCL
ncbi:hypothetical protein Nmel_010052 [Mimus melanotis]